MQSSITLIHRFATFKALEYLLEKKSLSVDKTSYFASALGRLLYITKSSLPYDINGYTSRTHALFKALQTSDCDVYTITRTGYPWDRHKRNSLALSKLSSLTLGSSPNLLLSYTEVDGIFYHHLPSPKNNCFTAIYAAKASRVVEKYCRLFRPAVIHAASNHVNALPALIAARRLGIPFQYEMRGLWELSRLANNPAYKNSHNFQLGLDLEGFVATHADKIFVISKQLGLYAQKEWGISAERLHLLPNCVNMEHFPAELTENQNIHPLTIGYAGSLVGYEGLDTLLYALKILRQSCVSAQLKIAGSGEAEPALRKLTRTLGLGEVVTFCGRMSPEDARKHIRHCAVVCLPRKPFAVCELIPPLKLIEAMAIGKPVIVPDLPVFHDEVEGIGWFFRPDDAEHLAQVLAEVFARPEHCAEKVKLGRKRVESCRQWKLFIPDILELAHKAGTEPCSAR